MGDSTGHEFQSLPDLRSSFASTLSYVQWQEKTGGGTRGRLWSLLVRVLHAERSESLAERKEDVLTCRRCSRERCSVETKTARRLSQHNESSSEETNLGLLCLWNAGSTAVARCGSPQKPTCQRHCRIKLVHFDGPPLRPVDAMRPRMSDAMVPNRFLWIPMRCTGRLRELARVVPWL